eukprot:3238972-Pleurochrysis_carterae.AAC.1
MHEVDAVKGLKIGGCPALSWSEMWRMLDACADGYREDPATGRVRDCRAPSSSSAAAPAAA